MKRKQAEKRLLTEFGIEPEQMAMIFRFINVQYDLDLAIGELCFLLTSILRRQGEEGPFTNDELQGLILKGMLYFLTFDIQAYSEYQLLEWLNRNV